MALQIDVSGNLTPILKSLDDLKADLAAFKAELAKATDPAEIARLNKELGKTEDNIKRIKNVGPIIPASTTQNANKTAAALTDVNRILQDLPFGFIGIQNNIGPAVESFRRLRVEAGSGVGVIKALAGSILGAGGFGLAITVVTTLLTFATTGFSAWTRGMGGAGSAAKKTSTDIEDLDKVLKNTAEDVAKSASRVTTLFNALESGTLNTSQRKKALDELKQQNQEFFGALKDEKGVIEGLQVAYDGYLQRLNAIATAKALETELTKLFDKRLQLELQLDPRFKAATSADNQKLIGTLSKQLAKLGGPVDFTKEENNTIANGNENLKKRADLMTRIAKLKTANVFDLSGTTEEIAKLDRQIAGIIELQKTTGNFQIGGSNESHEKKEEDFLKRRLEALEKIKAVTTDINALVGIQEQIFDVQVKIATRDQKKNKLSDAELHALIKGYQDQLNEVFQKQALSLEFSPKVKISSTQKLDVNEIVNRAFTTKEAIRVVLGNAGIKLDIVKEAVDVTDLQGKIARATGLDKTITVTLHDVRIRLLGQKKTTQIEGLEKINKDLTAQIEQSAGQLKNDVADTIGTALGEAFTSGDFGEGLKKGAQQLLSIVGGFMVQLGKYIISAAIQIQALKETLRQFAISNPALAIAGGIALIAAGSALKNVVFQGPKFATGGIVTGPTVGLVGEAGPEAIIPLRRLPDVMGNRGSGQPIVLSAGIAISGRKLVAFLQNESKSFNRIF